MRSARPARSHTTHTSAQPARPTRPPPPRTTTERRVRIRPESTSASSGSPVRKRRNPRQTPEPLRPFFDSPAGAQSLPHSATPLAVPPVRMPLCDRHDPCSPHDPHARPHDSHTACTVTRDCRAADRGASARMRRRTARRPRVSRFRGKARTRRRRTRPAPRRACARGR